MSHLMKIRPVGAELFHADGQIDMKLRVDFHNFANTPNKALLKLSNKERSSQKWLDTSKTGNHGTWYS